MFNNIGEKIKMLAQVLCWLGIIGSIIFGLVLIADNIYFDIGQGILIMIGGALLSCINSLVLYGFGELIKSNMMLVEQNRIIILNKEKNNSNRALKDNDRKEYVNDKDVKSAKCQICGKESTNAQYCKIVDDLGTRYRTICAECREKNHAVPTTK